jgi:ISXO2 transposase-like protein
LEIRPRSSFRTSRGVVDGRNDSAQHEDSADALVLGRVSDDTDKRGISALLLQRQLGLRRYETAWMLLHKLRRAMVNATREPLHGDVEVEDTWIGGPQPGIKGSRQLKDRRAVPVLVVVETRGDRSGRIRMVVLPNFTATTMTAILKQHVAPGSTIYTDGLGGFAGLPTAGFRHIALKQPLRRALRKGARSVVPLADRAIGTFSIG